MCMLSKVYAATTIGLDGVLIEAEVDVAGRGFPTFTIVGLPSKAIDEAKERVRTSITNAGFEMPDSRITVNLAPADIPKDGSSFDLPIAVGILASSGVINNESLTNCLFVGELSLEGKLRKVNGIISLAILAREKGIDRIFVPMESAYEAALIPDLTVYPVKDLTSLILHLNEKQSIEPVAMDTIQNSFEQVYEFDFAEIKGQEQAKRALEIAAAGFHNVHLKGAPGAGKTMLSRSFPSILPPLDRDEMMEVSKIYSIVGLLNFNGPIVTRPFRSPHHTTSRIGLIGGGSIPAPGEISLAHRGVLFLDEFPEFPRNVLEALRQPLEDGVVTISRASGSLTFPARFLLLAASNPCPCGFLGHPQKKCNCLPGMVLRYKKRLSGPLLDRIDLHVDVLPVTEEKLMSKEDGESSTTIRMRVVKARERAQIRFKDEKIKLNSQMTSSLIRKYCHLTDEATQLLKQAISKLSLSARSYFKIIKVAQTIADLEESDEIKISHIAESLQYRVKE